jgi:adenosylcobinamide-phosphate synthase
MNSDHSFDKILETVASPDRLMVAIVTLLLVSIVGVVMGPLYGNANPLFWTLTDRIIGNVARKTYKPERSVTSLAFRGTIFTVLFLIIGVSIGIGLYLLRRNFPLYGVVEPLVLSLTLSGGAVWFALFKLRKALEEGSKLQYGSYYPLAVSSRTDLNSTDDFGITRCGIGFMATSFDKGLVAPLFWYLVGGLPLAFLYATVAGAAWAFGKQGFTKGFGAAALWLEKLFGFLPHFLSGIILSFASLFTPTARLTRSLAGYFVRKGACPYNEGGLPVTITARALNVSLGGPVQDVDGSTLRRAWVGSATSSARLDKNHLNRAIYLSIMAHVLVFAALIGMLLVQKILLLM